MKVIQHIGYKGKGIGVTTILPRLNRVPRVPDVGSAYRLSPQSPVSESLRKSHRVSQMIFKLRELSSRENWYIYIVRKSRDRWLCTQSRIGKRSVRVGKVCAQECGMSHAQWL